MITAVGDYQQNMKRVTVTVPDNIFSYLKNNVKPGQVSDYVADAVLSRMAKDVLDQVVDPRDKFFEAYKKVTKKNNISIKDAINKGRA